MLKAGRVASAALRAVGQQQRFMAANPDRVTATLFPGDGIGPEICESVKQVRDHSQTHSLLSLHYLKARSCRLRTEQHKCPQP